jgi:hypothetical protein
MKNLTLAGVMACVIGLGFIASPALAQTAIDGGSVFALLKPYLVEGIGLAILAVVSWAAKLLHARTGFELDAKHRDTIQLALTNAAGLVISKVGDHMIGRKIDLKNEALAQAVGYVIKSAPDAVAHFGLTASELRQKVEAKIGVLTAPQANV